MALRRRIAALILTLIGLPVLLFVAGIVLLYCGRDSRPIGARPRRRSCCGLAASSSSTTPDDIVGQLVGRDDTTLRGI